MLIVIEGLDGAGKRTLADGLQAHLQADGKSVATLAFPRYGDSMPADLAAQALHGGQDGLADSIYAMAMLFALDRAGAAGRIRTLCGEHDVVILDRYVASNAAYTAARLHQDADGDAVDWIGDLEFDRLGLPKPDWQLLLDVSPELAADRARGREATESDRARDRYERDDGLQRRTAAVYAGLAAANWAGRWLTVGPAATAATVAAALGA